MDAILWIVIAVVVVLVVVVAARGRVRPSPAPPPAGRASVSEYDRTVDGADRRREAERELREREARHDELDLKPLSDASRQRYTQQWQEMQSGFVDRPQVAVADADRLITDLMRSVATRSTTSTRAASSCRSTTPTWSRTTAPRTASRCSTVEGRTSTEDLRQAVISYRALFEEMLVDEPSNHN